MPLGFFINVHYKTLNLMKNYQSKPTPKIVIKTLTWSRDSHGLFDYESKNVNKKYLTCQGPNNLIRIKNDVQLTKGKVSKKHYIGGDFKQLAQFEEIKGKYFLKAFEPEKLWVVVRTLKGNSPSGHVLSEGDIIKLGRVKYCVKELRLQSPREPNLELTVSEETSSEMVCKVCLYEGSTSEDPLITPCSCSGTMKYIHLQCLKRWLSSKMSTSESENSVIYNWKTVECEICKVAFPFTYTHKGNTIDLFISEKPKGPYLILEGVAREGKSTRGVHLISFRKKCQMSLGRGHESNLRVSDISVSRCHAMIKFVGGKFVLEDNNSKFGTLVQADDKYEIVPGQSVAFQIGRTVLSLSSKSKAFSKENVELAKNQQIMLFIK